MNQSRRNLILRATLAITFLFSAAVLANLITYSFISRRLIAVIIFVWLVMLFDLLLFVGTFTRFNIPIWRRIDTFYQHLQHARRRNINIYFFILVVFFLLILGPLNSYLGWPSFRLLLIWLIALAAGFLVAVSGLKKYWVEICAVLIIGAAMWLPRGLALDVFVTPDEPLWITRSANFYNALAQRDYETTYQKEHPGVTIMWAGTTAYMREYPSYIEIGRGEQDNPHRFKRWLDNQLVSVMDLLTAGRQVIVIAIIAASLLSFLAAIRLIGLLPAFVGFWLIAYDPFLIALSRLLHLDGLVSVMMLLSVLAWLCYLFRGARWFDLVISAVAAGLAWLTKSPALFLAPFIGLVTLIEISRLWFKTRRLTWRDVWRFTWPWLLWIGIAAGVFVLAWPAMWVDPVHTLGQIFSRALSSAVKGHEHVTFFNGAIYAGGIPDWRFYPFSYLWRATPPVLIGLILLVIASIWRRRFPATPEQRRTALYLALFAVLFTVFMTAGAKKFDRYLLPVFAPLNILAGLGWVTILKLNLPRKDSQVLNQPANSRWARPLSYALLGALLLFQTVSAQQVFPYYFNYYNPLLGGSARAPEVMMIGWGEGLDQAARYLNTKPDAKNLMVASWYADGPFSYIFNGETDMRGIPLTVAELENVDYLVLYTHQWQRQLPNPEFLANFENVTPEKIVTIGNQEYARIYRLR